MAGAIAVHDGPFGNMDGEDHSRADSRAPATQTSTAAASLRYLFCLRVSASGIAHCRTLDNAFTVLMGLGSEKPVGAPCRLGGRP